jgi:hypothetical protein
MKIFSLGALALIMMLFTACEEEPRAFPEFGDDNVQTGAFPRLIDGVNGIFDFFDIENSSINFTVEFYDVNEGRDVTDYNWRATYLPASEGSAPVGPVSILQIPSSSFGTSDFGLPSATINFDFSDVLDQLGIAASDVEPASTIRFESTLILNDGREFTRFNTGPNVLAGGSFQALFILDQSIVCPSDIGGTFAYTNVISTTWPDGCEPRTVTGEVTFTENAEGSYTVSDFSFGGYIACYGSGDPGGTLRFQDACNLISATGADSFGDGYTLTDLVIDGTEMTFTWTSDYGETGRVTIVNPAGWPDFML